MKIKTHPVLKRPGHVMITKGSRVLSQWFHVTPSSNVEGIFPPPSRPWASFYHHLLSSYTMSAPLHLAPSARSAPSVSLADTANSFGLHDTLRHGGGRNLAGEIKEDPFKRRMNEWEQTQLDLKLQMQRNAYGLGAPLRTLMDRKIISQDTALPEFSTSQFHLDILQGTDTSLDVQHFFSRAESSNLEAQNFQSQMERKHKI